MTSKHTPNERSQIAMRQIRKRRRAQGWSNAELARRLDEAGMPIGQSTLRNSDTGRRRDMTVDELYAFAEVLGTTPMALVETELCDTCQGTPPPGFECRTCGVIGSPQETR